MPHEFLQLHIFVEQIDSEYAVTIDNVEEVLDLNNFHESCQVDGGHFAEVGYGLQLVIQQNELS